jgi:hypothetical protein
MGDAGSHPQTSHASLETLSSTQSTKENVDYMAPPTNENWVESLPPIQATRIRRHTDVSQDTQYSLLGPTPSYYYAECTAAPSCIPPWVLPLEEMQALHNGGHCTTQNITYARGVSNTPDTDQTNFDQKVCTLVFETSDATKNTRRRPRRAPPPRRGRQAILGECEICRHPHRTHGYNAHKDPRSPHRRILHGSPKSGPH